MHSGHRSQACALTTHAVATAPMCSSGRPARSTTSIASSRRATDLHPTPSPVFNLSQTTF